jgi:Fe-S cluster assembly ATP-binding protein
MLELQNIYAHIDCENGERVEILKELNIKFQTGKIYAVTGPNGGGKTSMAKVIMGIYQHNQGDIYLDGQRISECSITERAQKGIGYAFQSPPRFKGLSVKDVLRIAAPEADDNRIRQYLIEVGLSPDDYLNRDLGAGLSGGEIKRIEMVQILLKDPQICIFDEPEAGVDLWTVKKLLGLIVSTYKNNPEKTAIVISHNDKIIPLCDEILIFEEGRITAQGTPNEIWGMLRNDFEGKPA